MGMSQPLVILIVLINSGNVVKLADRNQLLGRCNIFCFRSSTQKPRDESENVNWKNFGTGKAQGSISAWEWYEKSKRILTSLCILSYLSEK